MLDTKESVTPHKHTNADPEKPKYSFQITLLSFWTWNLGRLVPMAEQGGLMDLGVSVFPYLPAI